MMPSTTPSALRSRTLTYHVATQDYGYPARVKARDPRGGLKRLDLGYYAKMEQAKHACRRPRPDIVF